MRGSIAGKRAAVGLAAAGIVLAAASLAQDGGGLELTGTVGQSFEFSDNPDFIEDPTGTTFRSRTDLAFRLASQTQVQSLFLDFGTALRYTVASSSDTPAREGVTDPFVRLAYGRSSATARIDLTAAYSQSDVGDLRLVVLPDQSDLIVDEGEVERFSYTLGIDTGIGEPFGLSFDAAYSRRVYTETTDPDLNDDETLSVAAIARFAVTPTTDLDAVARYSRDQEFEGSTFDRETTRLGFGVEHEFNETARLSAEITGDTIDTTDGGGARTEEGYSVILGYAQDLPNGAFAVDATSIVESIGPRNTLSFTRSFVLPDGEIALLAGVTNNDTSDLAPVLRLDYARNLRSGDLSARIEQSIDQDRTSDDEFRNRILSLDYSQAINSVSGWSTGVGFAESKNLTDGSRVRRSDLELRYRRDLTQDWDIVSGYRYRETASTTDPDRTSNTVFVTFERSFAARP